MRTLASRVSHVLLRLNPSRCWPAHSVLKMEIQHLVFLSCRLKLILFVYIWFWLTTITTTTTTLMYTYLWESTGMQRWDLCVQDNSLYQGLGASHKPYSQPVQKERRLYTNPTSASNENHFADLTRKRMMIWGQIDLDDKYSSQSTYFLLQKHLI